MLTEELTNRRREVNWQEHALKKKEESLCLELLRVDTQPGALRDHLKTLMKEVEGCGWGKGAR